MSRVILKTSKDVLENLENLKPQEALIFELPEGFIEKLSLLNMKIKSSENLFITIMSKHSNEISDIKIDEFIDYYSGLLLERDEFTRENYCNLFGWDVFSKVGDKYGMKLFPNSSQIAVFKPSVKREKKVSKVYS